MINSLLRLTSKKTSSILITSLFQSMNNYFETRSSSGILSICIAVTSHEHHGISNHWQINSFFKSLLMLTSKKTSLPLKLKLVAVEFPLLRASNAKNIPMLWHYSDGIMGVMASQITSLMISIQLLIQVQIKENSKALRHWSLCGEITSDRWIPHTNGQKCGKCFHLITSSWHHHIAACYIHCGNCKVWT